MVEIDLLNFDYGQDSLFQNTSLKLLPGNIYGLLGLNGAGKSTLLRLIAGLLFPNSGAIDVLGSQPAKREPGFLAKLFVLPESVVVPNITDREYVSVLAPFYSRFDADQMDRFLSEFKVPRNRKLATLSHGQQKKFLLSFGLACNAELLMLDEPTNGLDIPSKGLFRRLVAESLTEDQIFVVSAHQVRDLESLIDSILILYEGQILFNQSVSEITNELRMSTSSMRPEANGQLLYSEQTLGGYANVWKDTSMPDGQLDLELLFKAVIASPEQCSTLFPTNETL